MHLMSYHACFLLTFDKTNSNVPSYNYFSFVSFHVAGTGDGCGTGSE